MINHFRTLLLNLSDVNDTDEYICPGFIARQLRSDLMTIFVILFPIGTARDDAIRFGNAYLEVINSAGLEDAITRIDSRLTYDLDSFNNFEDAGINLTTLMKRLSDNQSAITSIFSLPKQVDDSTYDNLWASHPNPIYKLAGLLCAYVTRLK